MQTADLFPDYVPDQVAAPPIGDCIDFSEVFGVTATNGSGYGRIWFDGKLWLAHRLAWCVAGRTLPAKPFLLRHRCNNRRCVNVDHLEVGTHRDNARDAVAAGTRPGKVLDRYELGKAYRMNLFGIRQEQIAQELGVTQNAISRTFRKVFGVDSSHRRPRFKPGCVGGPGRPRRYAAKQNASLPLFALDVVAPGARAPAKTSGIRPRASSPARAGQQRSLFT